MSGYTLTNNEVLFSSTQASTNLATFTTEDNLQKTLAPVIIPAGFFFNNGATGRKIRWRVHGLLGTTATPTFTFTLRLLTSTTWSAGGISLGATPATTTASGVTLASWYGDISLTMRNVNIGGASVVYTAGEIRSPKGFGTPFSAPMPDNNVSGQVSTVDNSVTYYAFLSAACSASSASNLINIQQLDVYGEN
jgi:hypothetical protein